MRIENRALYSPTEEQRGWVHKIANVLDKLPKRLKPRAKSYLHEIMRAEDRKTALEEMKRFREEYEAKYSKAMECLTKACTLFTFINYPAAHWLRRRTTKRAGSRDAGLAFELLTQAKRRWRRVNAPHLVGLVQAGVRFHNGKTRILPHLPADAVVIIPAEAASGAES